VAIAECCGKPAEVVSACGEVFAYRLPVAAGDAEFCCPVVSPPMVDTECPGVGDGHQPGPLEVQQLGSLGPANVAASVEAVLLVEVTSSPVQVAARLALCSLANMGNLSHPRTTACRWGPRRLAAAGARSVGGQSAVSDSR
jgi:hypothetical protein